MGGTPFDIREFAKDDGPVNQLINAAYDTLNRNVAVHGEITFRELFTQTWGDLVPQLRAPIARIEATAAKLLDRLLDKPSLSFKEMVHEPDFAVVEPYCLALGSLWRQYGILLPHRTGMAACDSAIQEAVDEMIEFAGHLTLRQLYEPRTEPYNQDTHQSVRFARAAGVTYDAVNYRCCTTANGNFICLYTPLASSCYTGCSYGSASCGRPPVPRPRHH